MTQTMKKILLFLIPFLLIDSCINSPELPALSYHHILKNQNPNLGILNNLNLSSSPLIHSSLNFIDSATTIQMIQKFQSLHSQDLHPQVVSYWISKEMLHSMVSLLNAEKAQGTGTNLTDGLRIYFVYDLSSNFASLGTSLAFVSTKDNGVFSGNYRKHKDYYSHLSSAPLFSLGSYGRKDLGYQVSGASLFQTCLNCMDNPNCSNSGHNLTYSTAQAMVHGFYGPSHSINTYSEWFDLGFLNYLDNETTHDGIRIYFGTYPINNATNPGKDAFVITFTVPSSTGYSVDSFNCLTSPQSSSQVQSSSSTNSSTQTNSSTSGGSAQDNGEMCPTNCNT